MCNIVSYVIYFIYPVFFFYELEEHVSYIQSYCIHNISWYTLVFHTTHILKCTHGRDTIILLLQNKCK